MALFDKNKIKAIVIGGSAGSIRVVKNLLQQLNFTPDIPIMIGLHRLQNDANSNLREVIQYSTSLPVIEPQGGEKIAGGNIYLAPGNYHLIVEPDHTFSLSSSPLVHYSRPSIDMLFLSAADVYRRNLMGILLTGANKDGATGMKAIKDKGGITVVQNPDECFVSTMPQAALALTQIDQVLNTDEIATFLNEGFSMHNAPDGDYEKFVVAKSKGH